MRSSAGSIPVSFSAKYASTLVLRSDMPSGAQDHAPSDRCCSRIRAAHASTNSGFSLSKKVSKKMSRLGNDASLVCCPTHVPSRLCSPTSDCRARRIAWRTGSRSSPQKRARELLPRRGVGHGVVGAKRTSSIEFILLLSPRAVIPDATGASRTTHNLRRSYCRTQVRREFVLAALALCGRVAHKRVRERQANHNLCSADRRLLNNHLPAEIRHNSPAFRQAES